MDVIIFYGIFLFRFMLLDNIGACRHNHSVLV